MKFKKLCAYCGEPFETNSPQKIYCNRPHYRPCPICGKPVKMIDNDFSRPPKCCSTECAHKLRQQKFKPRKCIFCGKLFTPKSGVQLVCNDIHHDTCEICGKQFIRTISNYNEHVTTCSPECTREKLKQHSLKKYGTEYPMQSNEVQRNFHAAMKAKYGVEHALQIPNKAKQQQETVIGTNMQRYGVPYASLLPQNIEARPNVISTINKDFGKKLNQNDILYEFEKPLKNRSYDIHILNTNVLIELNPTYTHNVIGNHYGKGLDKYYHRDKSQLAENNGYRCIHVWDWDDWNNIVNMIKPAENIIYARKCTVYKINKNIGDEFLNKYYYKGSCRGQLLYLGLVYENELVEIMTFGKPRYDKKFDVELMRLCTKSDTKVIGGASKLFSYATSEYGLSNIISYCDRSKFLGGVYEKLGMKLIRTTPPQEIWSKGTEHVTANLLRSRGYDQLFKTNYGKGVSNEELMLKSGWLPVYDCGQRVYAFK